MKFTYPAEKFASARISLMLPHPQGEPHSIATAFQECAHGLNKLNVNDLDGGAQAALRKLEELMDYAGLQDPTGRGTSIVKAENLSTEQMFELSVAVDHLASWFDAQGRMPSS